MIDYRTVMLTAAAAMAVSLPAQQPETSAPSKPPAAAAPAPKKTVAQLIEALGSDSYRTRLDAERSLRELGDAAVPELKAAAEQEADAEVQWRARRVLRQIERGGDATLQRRGEDPGDGNPDGDSDRKDRRRSIVLAPRANDPGSVRDQFESLFEHFERDFGIDIPRARFFEDGFFRDLQEQMKAGATRSQGMSMQIGPDGAVRVEVQEKGEDGKSETKVYEAPDMDTFQQKYPNVLHRNGLGMGLFPGGLRVLRGQAMPQWEFDWNGNGQGPRVWSVPGAPRGGAQGLPEVDMQDELVEPPPPPPAGKRLGIAIRPELPEGVREYLELDEGVGLMVESVGDGSLASALGLQKGDIVVKIGSRAVGSPQDVQEALGPIAKGAEVEVQFVRKGVTKTAKAPKTEATEPASAGGDDEGAPAESSGKSDNKGDNKGDSKDAPKNGGKLSPRKSAGSTIR